MLGKIWKRVLLIILIIACLFNVVKKIVQRESLKSELESTLNYFSKQNETVETNTSNSEIIKPNQSQNFDNTKSSFSEMQSQDEGQAVLENIPSEDGAL